MDMDRLVRLGQLPERLLMSLTGLGIRETIMFPLVK
jgi:hypothetical protein